MLYKILLKDRRNGNTAVITEKASSCLEDLSPRIKANLSLPYKDYCWHRFVHFGLTYVPIETEEYEYSVLSAQRRGHTLRRSEETRLSRLFTTINSSFLYEQDEDYDNVIRVDCILLERLP